MRDRERGSALMLMPAAVLVMMILGALAVDHSVVFLAERQVANLAAAAANDAAGVAVDRARLYEDGTIALDPAVARQVAEEAVRARAPSHLGDLAVGVDVDPAGATVAVRVSATVGYLFADAVPGSPDTVTVGASATAAAVEDG